MQLCVHVCVTVIEEHGVDSEPFLEILVTVNISVFFLICSINQHLRADPPAGSLSFFRLWRVAGGPQLGEIWQSTALLPHPD